VQQQQAIVQMASQALLLRQREKTRPAKATDMGALFVRRLRARRRGRRGDATKKGTATNRLPKDPASRERALAADEFGWFGRARVLNTESTEVRTGTRLGCCTCMDSLATWRTH
jgi:hypothetical protein